MKAALASLLAIVATIQTAPQLQRIKISPEVAERNLIRKVPPVYPQMAKVAHIQGDVIVQGVINKAGKFDTLKALKGHPILVQAAMDAVKQWEYKPFLLNGAPVEVESQVTVQFRL